MQDYIEHGGEMDTLEISKHGKDATGEGSFRSQRETPRGSSGDVMKLSEQRRRDKAANVPAKGGCGDEACCVIF